MQRKRRSTGRARRTFKRKSYRKRRSAKRRTFGNLGNAGRIGFPSSHIVKHRLTGGGNLTAIGSPANNDRFFISCNNMGNPLNQTTPNIIQPLGFDQWQKLYESYVVLGSKITVKFTFGEEGGTKPKIVGIGVIPYGAATTPDFTELPNTIIQQGTSSWRIIPCSPGAGADNQKTVSKKFSTKKYFQVKDVKDNIPRLGMADSTQLGGPQDQASFDIFYGNYDDSVVGTDVHDLISVHFVVEYIALWSQPISQARSTS